MKFTDLRRLTRHDATTRERLRSGELIRLTKEIAVPAAEYLEQKPWDQAKTRALAFGKSADRAALISLSAARVLGLSVKSHSPLVELSYVGHLLAPPRKSWPKDVTYRRSLLLPADITEHHDYRTTILERTVIDVARYHGVVEGVVVMDSALRDHGLDHASAKTYLENLGRARGVPRARRALALATGCPESALESWGKVELLEWGHPSVKKVEEQVEIALANGARIRLDFLVNGWLALELDGRQKYDGETFGRPSDQVIREERLRENAIQQLGIIVVRFGWDDLRARGQRSSKFLETVGTLLEKFGASGPGVVLRTA